MSVQSTLAGIFILLLAVGSLNGGAEQSPDPSWNTYTDQASGFSIHYPPGDALFFNATDTSRIIVISRAENQTLLQVTASPASSPLLEAAEELKKEIQTLEKPADLVMSDGLLGNKPAVILKYTASDKEKSIPNTIWLGQSDRYQYRIVGNGTGDQEQLVREIVNSFEYSQIDQGNRSRSYNDGAGWNNPGIIYDPFGMMTGQEGTTSGWNQYGSYPGYLYGQAPYDYWYYYQGDSEEWDDEPYPVGEQNTPEPAPTMVQADSSTQTDTEHSGTQTQESLPAALPTLCTQDEPDGSEAIQALIIVSPDNYNEEELTGVQSALDGAGIGYDIASTRSGDVTGMSGGSTGVDLTIADVQAGGISKYAGIIIVGGEGAITGLYDDNTLMELVRTFNEQEKIVSAICASPVILSRAGILDGKTVTMFGDPVLQEEVRAKGASVVEDPVITDGRIITGNGPYAADEFGKTVASALK